MKQFLLLSLVLLSNRLSAGQAVVFGEKDVYVLDSGSALAGPTVGVQRAFFQGYKAQVKRQVPLENALELTSPPEWGKTVSAATHGRIQFHASFPGGFACHVALDSLLPHHDYILTLNGNPAKSGNGLLLSAVPGNPQERYYDFLIITTDSNGHYDESLGIFLKAGSYDVRFYVKDTGDFKIVLYHDFFPFSVE
jgi:hypothetical protein